MTARARSTRRPTGKPPWPIVLLTAPEKCGKSYMAAVASASDLVGRTLWLSIGEDDPDEYGKLPGADFEIVEHDGTYRDILDALTWASEQPRVGGKPTLIVVDSMGRGWDLLSDMAQAEANKRRGEKTGEARIASDLWNLAGQRWGHLLDTLRGHDGPVIVTARLERQTVFSEDGNPTKDKHLKVKAQKALPFDVGVVVEIRARDDVHVTGARSLSFYVDPETRLPDFTVDELWRRMGLAEPDATAPRQHSGIDAHAETEADTPDAARSALLRLCGQLGLDPGSVAARYAAKHSTAIQAETDPAKLRQFAADLQAEHDAAETGGQS